MSKKTSDSPITSLSQDWAYDPIEGLPYNGANIQAFIKSHLGKIAKAAWFNPATSTMYYFASEDDMTAFVADTTQLDKVLYSTAIVFGSTMYRLLLTNNNGSTNLSIATNETSLVLSIDFDCQSKEISGSSWTSSGKGAKVTVYADPGGTGTFTVFKETAFYRAGTTLNVNVRNILVAGTNRIKVQYTMEDDESITSTITYNIDMVEMYIELMNNEWHVPIVEGGDPNAYKLGGFKIVGSLSKTLHIKIYSNESELKHFQQIIGTASYSAVPFNYTQELHNFDISDLPTGVFLVVAYLTAGTTVSIPVQYNIMHIAEEDTLTAQLCCINNVADLFYNYTTSELFEYAIYNGGASTGNPHIIVRELNGTTPTIIKNENLTNVTTSERHSLSISLEWLVEETLNLFLSSIMTFGNEQVATVPIDNSATFPPVPGYTLYFNAASRSNSDLNKTSLVNLISGNPLIPVTWTRMAWMDDIDGWTHDPDGRACLLIPAGSRMEMSYTNYRLFPRDNITIEMCYKIANVSDYTENVITIADDPTAEGFKGIRIRPTNITVHSSADTTAENDLSRGKNVKDEELIHLIVTIHTTFKGNTGRNLVTGYINGCKNFEFEYASGTVWTLDNNLVLGADHSDLYMYFMRAYPSVLSEDNAKANYINSLGSLTARQDMAEVLSSVMTNDYIDFAKVRDNNYNFFVIEMLNGANLPSKEHNWDREQKGRSNLEMHFGMHPEWDWKIMNVETGGQGTTSMNYWLWNLRWRIDKTGSGEVPISYLISRNLVHSAYDYEWGAGTPATSVVFDGAGNHPNVQRITAKINFASSMQSHKIGATRAYTDLHDALGLSNEAQDYAETHHLPKPTVAVYQYPAFGFEKQGDNYVFIGLFTIGPDKGDAGTFGYDLEGIPENLISMEGTDHARRLVMFNTPWNSDTQFLASNECLNVVDTVNDRVDKGWEVGNCHGLKTSKVEKQAQIQEILETYFKPAYDLVYNNSTLIVPVALNTYAANAADTLAYINSHKSAFQSQLDSTGRMFLTNYQFWIEGEYVLYYLDFVTGDYEAGINLVTDLGTPPVEADTLDKKNEWFKAQRRARFMASAENYWDITDALFHMSFLCFTGSMDNFGKNTYPYFMGGTWKWRQDDLDSLFGIGNAGADNMPTWMEFTDSKNGSLYFGGSNSIFWNLIYECYKEDYTSTITGSTAKGLLSVGQDMVAAMVSLGGGANTMAGIFNFIKTRFWDNAQNYFPQTAYNVDASLKYEAAWLANGQDVPPLTQSLGNHYLAEYLWVYKRIIYMMSFFHAGPFKTYSDTSLGQIAFRPLNLASITVTPEDYLYPALAVGQGMTGTARRGPGEPFTFEGPFGADGQTYLYLQATNILKSVGDFKDLVLASGYVNALNVEGKKLILFKIGDENATKVVSPAVYYTQTEVNEANVLLTGAVAGGTTLTAEQATAVNTALSTTYAEGDTISTEDANAYNATLEGAISTSDIKTNEVTAPNITTNIPGLIFPNNYCLVTINAKNATSIGGEVDLSNCSRLREAWFDGTHVTKVTLGNGQKIEELTLSDYTSAIVFRNLLFLDNFSLPADKTNIDLLKVENCLHINGFMLLAQIYKTSGNSLIYISVQENTIKDAEESFFETMIGIANGKNVDGDDTNYYGVNAASLPAVGSTPILEGTVHAIGMHVDIKDQLNLQDIEDYEGGLKIALVGLLTFGLHIIYDLATLYIRFADAVVEQICATAYGDGVGTNEAQASAVTATGLSFRNNTQITKFNELAYFDHLTTLSAGTALATPGAFGGCTSLTEITLPDTVTNIGKYAFSETKITSFVYAPSCRYDDGVFSRCSKLRLIDINNSNSAAASWFNRLGESSNPSTIILGGNWSGSGDWGAGYVKKMVVKGNVNTAIGTNFNSCQEFRVKGNITSTSSLGMFYPNTNVKFFEVMGTCYQPSSNGIFLYQTTNYILHLGHTAVVAARPAKFKLGTSAKVYVGPGLSQEEDEAILELYRQDADWGPLVTSGKVATWWSYTGTYKE